MKRIFPYSFDNLSYGIESYHYQGVKTININQITTNFNRLNQQRRFNLAKTKLKEKVLQDSKQQPAENESEEDMDKVNEEGMIYFE